MAGPPRANTPADGVVLWQRGAMTCTCHSDRPNRIQIRLIVVGVVVENRLFSDSDDASNFALDKMHAYEGLPLARSRIR